MPDHHNLEEIYPHAVWRVIIHRPMDGPMNMAVDEAISEAVGAGDSPPTLRFYAWNPACLSLGYTQSINDVDLDKLAASGWDIVRRQTGGRAILHIDELTYSLIAPLADPRVSGGVIESYRRLSEGLVTGLEGIGAQIEADKAAEGRRNFKGPVCFEAPSDYEITAEGKKLLGSAQTRRGEILLQHGALPLYGDIARICDVLAFDDDTARETARQRVEERATTLAEAIGERYSMVRVVGSLMKGFVSALNIHIEEDQLSEWEQSRAEELRQEKYSDEAWTSRY